MIRLPKGIKNMRLKDIVKRGPRCQCMYQGCNETFKKGGLVAPKFKVYVPPNVKMPNLALYCAKHRKLIRRQFIWGILEPGDVGAQRGSGPIYRTLRWLMTPDTDRYHHFLIWKTLSNGDWVILESIGRGFSVGKLDLYNGKDVKFYRVLNATAQQRKLAPEILLDYARSNYDYWLPVKLALKLIFIIVPKMVFIKHKIGKIDATEVPYRRDDAFICTEAVQQAYLGVKSYIVPEYMLPVPASFKKYGSLQLILETPDL